MEQLKERCKFIKRHPTLGSAMVTFYGSVFLFIISCVSIISLLHFSYIAMGNYESALLLSRVNKNERVAESTFKGCVGYEQKIASKNQDDAIYIPDMIYYGCIELPPIHLLSLDEQLYIVQKTAFELTKSTIIDKNSICAVTGFYGLCENVFGAVLHLLIFSKDHLMQLLAVLGGVLLQYFIFTNGPWKYYKQYIDINDSINMKSKNGNITQTAFTKIIDERNKAKTASPVPKDVFYDLTEPLHDGAKDMNNLVYATNPGLNPRRIKS